MIRIVDRNVIAFVVLIAIVCAPVWFAPYYFNQDGTPHLYNAYLITELLRGNQSVAGFAAFNSYPVPNLTGHWLLAMLVLLLPPIIATKFAVTALFALFVGSIVWLRAQVVGRESMTTVLLFAAALGLNWMWFIGFYNFILGCCAFAFTLGLWWRWRVEVTPRRALVLFLLIVITFLSHLIPFLVLIFSLGVLSLTPRGDFPKRTRLWTHTVVAFSLPLLLSFLLSRPPGGQFGINWRYMPNVVVQLSSADPFAIISRITLPFTSVDSAWASMFSPFPWIAVALALLLVVSVVDRRDATEKPAMSWLVIAATLTLAWIFGPDDFGSEHGAYLRERCLLLGLIALVPFVRVSSGKLVIAAHACLVFVIFFQTTAIAEYAIRSNRIAADFVEAKQAIGDTDAIATVTFIPEIGRFKSIPETNISPYLGIGKSGVVWDNYELGLDIFPLVAKTPAQQRFIHEFREASTFNPRDPEAKTMEKLERLKALMAENHDAIDVLLVWHERPELMSFASEWFQTDPYFVSGDLKLYRHR